MVKARKVTLAVVFGAMLFGNSSQVFAGNDQVVDYKNAAIDGVGTLVCKTGVEMALGYLPKVERAVDGAPHSKIVKPVITAAVGGILWKMTRIKWNAARKSQQQ